MDEVRGGLEEAEGGKLIVVALSPHLSFLKVGPTGRSNVVIRLLTSGEACE